jgi:hypothetical protein
MTFTLRLTADLTLALAARAMGKRNSDPPILQLSPETDFQTARHASSCAAPVGGNGSQPDGSLVSRYRSPILWIAGGEPLEYPEIARFTNALASSGRHVFLQTSGAALKRRLHEFQPSSRFYFAIRFDGAQPRDEQRSTADDAHRVGLEAIRMAQLAGFFTCAHLVVGRKYAPGELSALHAEIRTLHVDGFLLTRATDEPGTIESVRKLRSRFLSRRWALLSRLIESSSLSALPNARQSNPPPLAESQPASFEEGAEAG